MIRRILLLAVLLPSSWLLSQTDETPSFAERHRRWLEEVAILITPEEYDAFRGLEENYRRDTFIERFWRAHDPFPETGRNELRDLWERRLGEAREAFGTLGDVRAQIFLLTGKPTTRQRGDCVSRLLPLEVWGIGSSPELPRAFSIVFVKDPRGGNTFRVWAPEEGLSELLLDRISAPATGDQIAHSIRRQCDDGEELLQHLERAVSLATLKQYTIPAASQEWVATFLSRSTSLVEDARTFHADVEISYPARYRSRTEVQVAVNVPTGEIAEGDSKESFRFLLDGEILRQGRLFESFRYRFDLPRDSIPDNVIPLSIQRHLRPGRYTLTLRIEDLLSQSFFRESRDIDVPSLSKAPMAPQDVSVSLLRPPLGLHTGKLRVHARTSGEGIVKVAFELDGKRLMSKRRRPWSVEVDLGTAPHFHSLRAVAIGSDGSALASDEITLNAGPQQFAVRLVEPEPGRRYQRSLRARAVVDVPSGARLDRMELFLNEERLSTLYQGPFVHSLLLPESSEMAYVRAVAYLEDGHSTEALVVVNAPEYLDRVEIDLVELYTTVVDRRGRPIEDLNEQDFQVLENQIEQKIRRFERARNLSFHAAIVLDTSTSMAAQLRQTEKAAMVFFEKIVTARDRAAVVTFSDQPRLVVPFTSNLEVLAGGLADLEADGETALHDSVVFTLYHFGGVRGQRALILLSDGMDSISRYSFPETLDFARETGVTIYTIGLDIPSSEHEARSKLRRLSKETGGKSFFIRNTRELDRVYQTIERELRSQYLIAYQSSTEDQSAFRRISVKLSDPKLTAKTLSGYHP